MGLVLPPEQFRNERDAICCGAVDVQVSLHTEQALVGSVLLASRMRGESRRGHAATHVEVVDYE